VTEPEEQDQSWGARMERQRKARDIEMHRRMVAEIETREKHRRWRREVISLDIDEDGGR